MKKLRSYKTQCYCLFIVLMSACATGVNAQQGIDTALANALQSSINNLRVQYNVKGIMAAAYIPGKGIWKGVTGVSYGNVPMDTNFISGTGSITKTFVAAEIFKLVEAGQLSLDDTIGALLPVMNNVNAGIKVRQLLNHTSGMGDYLNNNWETAMFAAPATVWYYPAAFDSFLSAPTGGPGSPWNYANANYALLGMIIEAKKNDSIHHVLRNELIQPLGLNNTYMDVYEPYPNTIPHNWVTPSLNPALAVDSSTTPHQALWSSVEPAGGYFADAADIAKWGYNLYTGNIISASSLSQMETFTNVNGGYFNGYGLGVMRFTANGRTYYGHAGNYYGYAGSMIYYPHDSLCVAVLINQDCIATYEADALMNILIKKLATGINNAPPANNITIAPNPANAAVNITIPDNKDIVAITITDVVGNVLYKRNVRSETVTINTTDYNNGIYFIKLTDRNGSVIKEMIIHH